MSCDNNLKADENIIEWYRHTARTLRMKEIELSDERRYEEATVMRDRIKDLRYEIERLYPGRIRWEEL